MKTSLKIRQFLSLLLVLALLLQIAPTQALAQDTEPVSTAAEVAPGEAGKTVLGEVTENREQSQKHFRLDDGSFLAVDYGLAVHYAEEDGSWEDIDNTLTLQGSADSNAATASAYSGGTSLSGGQYIAENGEDTKAFASDLSSGFLFAAHTSELGVSMSLASPAPSLDDPITMDEEATLQGGHNQFATAQITYPDDPAETQGDASLLSWLFPEETEEPSLLEQAIPTRLRAEVLYEDVYDGIDLLYELYGSNVKETIRVNYAQSDYTYSFRMETEGLTPSLQEDGSVCLFDADGEILYLIPAPYMTDADNAYSDEVHYDLTQDGLSWLLTVNADAAWIEAPERAFPVDIDPTLIDVTEADSFLGYICNQKNHSVSAATNLACGYHPEHQQMEIYYKLSNMPTIPAGCTLTKAEAGMYQNDFRSGTNSTSGEIVLYMSQIMTATNFNDDIEWESRPATGEVLDYTLARNNTIGTIRTWDITAAAKDWYASGGATNYGLAMTSNSNSVSKTRAWFNYGHDIKFAVTYRSTTGLEDWYTYQTAGAGNAGFSSISDFTGQLTQTIPITRYTSEVNPFSLELYYNSGYCTYYEDIAYSAGLQQNLDMVLGAGVSMNIMQYIEKDSVQDDYADGGTTTYLRLTDGDGTWHHFAKDPNRQSKYYYDEEGMGLKIWEYATNCYKVYEHDGEDTLSKDNEDPADYRLLFINGHLREMRDQNNNIIRINYQNGNPTATGDRIVSVDQINNGGTAISIFNFQYSDYGTLQTITDAAGVVFAVTLSNGCLTEISRNEIVIAQYAYEGKRMKSAYDAEAKQGISFVYTDGKLSRYYEYAMPEGVEHKGREVAITYPGEAQTTYHDFGASLTSDTDDLFTTYLFNYAGRTVNAYTTDKDNKVYGASNAVYSGTGTTDMKNNRTLRTASIGVAAMNELHDHGFEKASSAWSFTGAGGSNTNILVKAMTGSSELVRTGTYGCKGWIKAGNTSTISVSRDTYILYANTAYTFSAYVNTSQCTAFAGKGLYLQFEDSAGNKLEDSEALNYKTDTAIDGGWVRLSVTFTPDTTGTYTVSLYNHGAGPYCYTDDWQLEASETPSNLNLLENGNLQYWGYGWTRPTVTTGGYTYLLADYHSGEGLFTQDEYAYCLRTYGDAYTNNHGYQDVPINQTGGSYVLSGWAKANAVPDNVQSSGATAETDLNKQFGLRAMITYSDNSTEYHYAPFCPDIKDWQFTSLTIVPKKPTTKVTSIRVICAYEKNDNEAFFDNLCLSKEVAQTMDYNDKGELVSVQSTGTAEETATYDKGLLKEVTTGGSGTFTYDYDGNKNLTSATNSIIKETYTYNTMGAITGTTTTKADGTGSKIASSAVHSTDGNRVTKQYDSRGNAVEYSYESSDLATRKLLSAYGLPRYIEDPKGNRVSYSYDLNTGRTLSTYMDGFVSIKNTYTNDRLTQLQRVGFYNNNRLTQKYIMEYDVFGNMTQLSVGADGGNQVLATYEYAANNGNLTKQTYGNGDYIEFTYDKLNRTASTTTSDGDSYAYSYTGDGQLYKITDTAGGLVYQYTYDTIGRLIGSEMKQGETTKLQTWQKYDTSNRIIGQSWNLEGTSYEEGYTYDDNGRLTKKTLTLPSGTASEITNAYDTLSRLSTQTGAVSQATYSYLAGATSDKTTSLVSSVTHAKVGTNSFTPVTFSYTYDTLGNILTATQTGYGTTTYAYDDLGQLLSETTSSYGAAEYEYDTYGNIRYRHGADGLYYTMEYGNNTWRDLLTKVTVGTGVTEPVSVELVYDASGNPTTYFNGQTYNMTWRNGRELDTVTTGGKTYSYEYDINNLRTSKVVNGITHYYTYAGGKLLREEYGTTTLDFMYDASGRPYILNYTNGSTTTTYYYITNLQGDVVRIVDTNGATVVQYHYDAWGNPITLSDSSSNGIGTINPLRYRGYYYDTETGFYYLQSRYYDPTISRFINADGAASTGQGFIGCNMFTYCLNNPTIYADFEGTDAIITIDNDDRAGGFGHVSLYVQDSNNDWWYFSFASARNSLVTLWLSVNAYGVEGNIQAINMEKADGLDVTSLNGFIAFAHTNTPKTIREMDSAIYLVGDYSASANFCNERASDTVGYFILNHTAPYSNTYHLFSNNCMHFVADALLASDSLSTRQREILYSLFRRSRPDKAQSILEGLGGKMQWDPAICPK